MYLNKQKSKAQIQTNVNKKGNTNKKDDKDNNYFKEDITKVEISDVNINDLSIFSTNNMNFYKFNNSKDNKDIKDKNNKSKSNKNNLNYIEDSIYEDASINLGKPVLKKKDVLNHLYKRKNSPKLKEN